jgi:pimeloyl-ACP methyl ester carboxylesterase
MVRSHSEEVVWTNTSDCLCHHGLLIRPVHANQERQAVVWMHGATLSFSDPLPVLVGRRLAARGHTFVTGNNRGHHALVPLGFREDGRMIPGGTWAEKLSESALDVVAWIDFASALGFTRVVLVGHSYGGAKVICYQAERSDIRLTGIVAASTPVRPNRSVGSPEATQLAERMVAEGRGDELLPYGVLGRNPNTRTAAAYLDIIRNVPDVFGVESGEPPVSRLRCPLLAIFGTDEPHIGTAADLDVVRRNAHASAQVETRMVVGDHLYTGNEAALADVLAEWMAAQLLA